MNRSEAVDLGRAAVRAGTVGSYSVAQERLVDALTNIMCYADAESLDLAAALVTARRVVEIESAAPGVLITETDTRAGWEPRKLGYSVERY